MDFVRSYFFTNATLTSCPLFCILSSLLDGCRSKATTNPPKSDETIKKWATGQSCIRKDITSYKIHTLVNDNWLNVQRHLRCVGINVTSKYPHKIQHLQGFWSKFAHLKCFWIKNCVYPRSIHLEATYIKALLYVLFCHFFSENMIVETKVLVQHLRDY